MDIKKQIEYWINTAGEDLQTAELLINNNKILFGLFLCHLCIEKAIKANIVKHTGNIPPKVHNLSYLIERTNLELSDEQFLLCDTLMYYQLEGRYPEYYKKAPSKSKSKEILNQTKTLYKWLKTKL